MERNSESNNKDANSDYKLLDDWLEVSQPLENADMSGITTKNRTRFQIGSPQYGWSSALWQVNGIQFASFTSEKEGVEETVSPTFLSQDAITPSVMVSLILGIFMISAINSSFEAQN